MKRLLLIAALLAPSLCFAQGYRFDSQISQEFLTTSIPTLTAGGLTNVLTIPSSAQIAFCSFPANAVPCTNKATTYTSVTLGTPCSTSTQITLTGSTSCVASPDTQQNWGVWIPAGQYSYTITLPGGINLGPYVVNFGVPSGTNLNLGAITCVSVNGIACVSNGNPQAWAGADACAWITSALAANNIVDARGLSGSFTCATSFSVNTNQSVYLGNATLTVSAQVILVGSSSHLYGIGNDSVIKAAAGFTANTPVVEIGSTGVVSPATVEGMKIDCSSITNGIGGENLGGQELSGFINDIAANCTKYGFWYEGTNTQNSYGEKLIVETAGTGAIGVYVHNAPIRGISNLTVTSNDGNTPADCMVIDGTGGNYDGIHCDKATIGIDIGPTSPVSIQRISNVTGGSTTPTLIQIENTAGNRVILMGISSNGSATNINDILDGSPASASYEPFWAVGQSGQGQFRFFQTPIRAVSINADLGTHCTNGELALSAGWQSTGAATVTAVQGNGQTCSWTITTGTTTAANPTITDTLTNPLPNATTVCTMNIYGGTHTAVAGESLRQTTLSATAPIFTANFTPTANGFTYFVTRVMRSMIKRLLALLTILFAPISAFAQVTSVNQGGSISATSSNCSTSFSCVWESVLPNNASTTTITISGTFTATLLVEESNSGSAGVFTTVATLSAAGLTTYATNGITDIRVRCSAYTSGTAVVTISTGLNTGPQGPPGPAGSGGGSVTQVTSLPATCTPGQSFQLPSSQIVFCGATANTFVADGVQAVNMMAYGVKADLRTCIGTEATLGSATTTFSCTVGAFCNGTTVACPAGQTSDVGKRINGTNGCCNSSVPVTGVTQIIPNNTTIASVQSATFGDALYSDDSRMRDDELLYLLGDGRRCCGCGCRCRLYRRADLYGDVVASHTVPR